ncbi:MAG: class II aldolase/adducin family protein [Steroidobacteraceae bacterium]
MEELVLANHILANLGLLDAFGHVSVRDPLNDDRYLLSRWVAPALVTARDIIPMTLDSEPVYEADKNKHLYSERYIHGEIYKARPDVMAVVHAHTTKVVACGVSGIPFRPLQLNAAFLGDRAPVFEMREHFGPDTDLLIRNAARGKALAAALGGRAVVLMRGHGETVIGESIKVAVWNTFYTDVNAGELIQAISLGHDVTYLSPGEVKMLSTGYAKYAERPWELWVRQAASNQREVCSS